MRPGGQEDLVRNREGGSDLLSYVGRNSGCVPRRLGGACLLGLSGLCHSLPSIHNSVRHLHFSFLHVHRLRCQLRRADQASLEQEPQDLSDRLHHHHGSSVHRGHAGRVLLLLAGASPPSLLISFCFIIIIVIIIIMNIIT